MSRIPIRTSNVTTRPRRRTITNLPVAGAGLNETYNAAFSRTYSQPRQRTFVQPRQGTYVQSRQGTFVQPRQGTFVQPRQGTFVQPRQGTFVQPRQGTFVQPRQGTFVQPQQGTFVQPRQGTYAQPRQGTFVQPGTAPAALSSATAFGPSRRGSTAVNREDERWFTVPDAAGAQGWTEDSAMEDYSGMDFTAYLNQNVPSFYDERFIHSPEINWKEITDEEERERFRMKMDEIKHPAFAALYYPSFVEDQNFDDLEYDNAWFFFRPGTYTSTPTKFSQPLADPLELSNDFYWEDLNWSGPFRYSFENEPNAQGTYVQPAQGTYVQPAQGTYVQPAQGTYVQPAARQGTYVQPAARQGTYVQPAARQGTYVQPAARQGTYVQPAARQGTYVQPPSRQGTYVQPANATYRQPAVQGTNVLSAGTAGLVPPKVHGQETLDWYRQLDEAYGNWAPLFYDSWESVPERSFDKTNTGFYFRPGNFTSTPIRPPYVPEEYPGGEPEDISRYEAYWDALANWSDEEAGSSYGIYSTPPRQKNPNMPQASLRGRQARRMDVSDRAASWYGRPFDPDESEEGNPGQPGSSYSMQSDTDAMGRTVTKTRSTTDDGQGNRTFNTTETIS